MTEKEDQMILKTFLCFVWAQLTCLFAIGIAIADSTFLPSLKFSEYGLVENAQALLLLLTSGIYVRAALQRDNCFYFLIAGFVACMFVRELDYFLDYIKHGFWFYIDLVITAVFVVLGVRKGPRRLIAGLRECLNCRSFVWMLAGLTVTLCFSRLIGSHHFWIPAIGENFFYTIKRAVEETSELWGYALMFTSALFLIFEKPGEQP